MVYIQSEAFVFSQTKQRLLIKFCFPLGLQQHEMRACKPFTCQKHSFNFFLRLNLASCPCLPSTPVHCHRVPVVPPACR